MTDGTDRSQQAADASAPAPVDPTWLWAFGGTEPGYRPMIEVAGTTAAPLLAGFSFTLFVLVLPTIDAHRSAARVASSVFFTGSDPFSRYPTQAALLLLLAGLLLIASVQAALAVKRHGLTPSQLAEWFPEHVRSEPPASAEERERLKWDLPGLPAMHVSERWYAGLVRRYQRQETTKALWWARVTRYAYHLGILALLAGLAVLVVPPAGTDGGWRWALFGVATAGVIGEALWIVLVSDVFAHLRRHRR